MRISFNGIFTKQLNHLIINFSGTPTLTNLKSLKHCMKNSFRSTWFHCYQLLKMFVFARNWNTSQKQKLQTIDVEKVPRYSKNYCVHNNANNNNNKTQNTMHELHYFHFIFHIWASKLNVILHLCVDFSETKKKILIQTLYVTLHTLLCSFLNIFFFYHLLLQSSQFNIFKNVLNAFLEKKKFLLRIWRIGLFSMHHWWWLWFKGRIPLFFAL